MATKDNYLDTFKEYAESAIAKYQPTATGSDQLERLCAYLKNFSDHLEKYTEDIVKKAQEIIESSKAEEKVDSMKLEEQFVECGKEFIGQFITIYAPK